MAKPLCSSLGNYIFRQSVDNFGKGRKYTVCEADFFIMMEDCIFKIGEFSKLTQMLNGILRYYDRIEIFKLGLQFKV